MGKINEDLDVAAFRAGAIANVEGDIWAAPLVLIEHGKCAVLPDDAQEATHYGWRIIGQLDARYTCIERRACDRPGPPAAW